MPQTSQPVRGQLGLRARQLGSLMCHLDNIALSARGLTVTQLTNDPPFLSHPPFYLTSGGASWCCPVLSLLRTLHSYLDPFPAFPTVGLELPSWLPLIHLLSSLQNQADIVFSSPGPFDFICFKQNLFIVVFMGLSERVLWMQMLSLPHLPIGLERKLSTTLVAHRFNLIYKLQRNECFFQP